MVGSTNVDIFRVTVEPPLSYVLLAYRLERGAIGGRPYMNRFFFFVAVERASF